MSTDLNIFILYEVEVEGGGNIPEEQFIPTFMSVYVMIRSVLTIKIIIDHYQILYYFWKN